jgi:hypothetical protein
LFRHNQSRIKAVEKNAAEDWQEFCEEKIAEHGDTIGCYLEEVKKRLIVTDYKELEEIIIGMLKDH